MLFGQELNTHRIFKRLAKALIRLHICAGWSGPLLVAHTTLLEISCHSSNTELNLIMDNKYFFLITAKAKAECYDYQKKSILIFQ